MEGGAYHDIIVGIIVEVSAALSVSKLPNADAIGRMKLLDQEGATGILDLCQLQEASCGQQAFHVVLSQIDDPCMT